MRDLFDIITSNSADPDDLDSGDFYDGEQDDDLTTLFDSRDRLTDVLA